MSLQPENICKVPGRAGCRLPQDAVTKGAPADLCPRAGSQVLHTERTALHPKDQQVWAGKGVGASGYVALGTGSPVLRQLGA